MAQAALAATAHGHQLPASWLVGRPSRKGPTYGVFLEGKTTAKAIAATGAIPGTVLAVGATAQATLTELNALAAIPGISEVELAGKTTKQLDQSVPAIHASEPGSRECGRRAAPVVRHRRKHRNRDRWRIDCLECADARDLYRRYRDTVAL